MYSVCFDGADPQTVQMKSIVALLPLSGDMAGLHVIAMIAIGLVDLKSFSRFLACQKVALVSIANGMFFAADLSIKSAARLNGGLVMMPSH